MKQSGTNPKALIVLGVLVVAAVYMLLIKPQGSELSGLKADAASAQKNLDDARVVLAQAQPNGADDADAGAEELALGLAVPPSPELSALLRQLQTIATETGVTYASVSPTTPGPNPAGPGGSVPLTINASGTSEAIDAYLGRLRDLERMMVIEQLNTSNGSAAAIEIPETQLQVSVRVFTTATPLGATAA